MDKNNFYKLLYFIIIILFVLVIIFAIVVGYSNRNNNCKYKREKYENYIEHIKELKNLKHTHLINTPIASQYDYQNSSILECTNFLNINCQQEDISDILPIGTTEYYSIFNAGYAFYIDSGNIDSGNILIFSFHPKDNLKGLYEQIAPTELRNYQKGMLVNVDILNCYMKIRNVVKSIYEKYDENKIQLIFTGHGLGGAIATLAALDYASIPIEPHVYIFASPCVGNVFFARIYNKLLDSSWHIYNTSDQVVHNWIPAVADIYSYEHTGIPIAFTYNLIDYYLNHTIAYKNIIIDQLNLVENEKPAILSENDLITSSIRTPIKTPKKNKEKIFLNKNDLIYFNP